MPSVRLWPAGSREKRKKAPTSRNDLLVLVVASVVEGEAEKAPTSCNDSLVLAWLRERPPTSLYNSLVLVVPVWSSGRVEVCNLDVSN